MQVEPRRRAKPSSFFLKPSCFIIENNKCEKIPSLELQERNFSILINIYKDSNQNFKR